MDNEKLKKINQMNEEYQKLMNQYNENINLKGTNPNIPFNNTYYGSLDNYNYNFNSNFLYIVIFNIIINIILYQN